MNQPCAALSVLFVLTAALWIPGCRTGGGDDSGNVADILFPPMDSEVVDSAVPDDPGGDLTGDDIGGRDIPVYLDISGVDLGAVECVEDLDCPQSGKPCEWVRCDPATNSCVQSNSSKSGDMCDEGYLCRRGGRCEDGVCVYHSVECRDCGDGICFNAGENCADCVADCGACPPAETECRDGLDEDYDGETDCDDSADCDWDPRCGRCKCVSCDPEEWIGCGQSQIIEPFGPATFPDVEACGHLPSEFASAVYRFDSAADQEVRVKLTPGAGGEAYRVFVLEGNCNPEYCIENGSNSVDAVFHARDGWTYYLLIDCTSDFAGEVTVEVECPR